MWFHPLHADMACAVWQQPADITVIPSYGLARQELPYIQALAGDGNWAYCVEKVGTGD
jgi:hypothetical protein